jgi:protease I
MSEKPLEGVTVAVLVADGFEQIEVTRPIRALHRAGADVRILSLRPGRLRGMNFMWRGRKLPVDQLVARADPEDYGALLLPGGFVNPDLLRQNEHAREFVANMDRLGRPIAVICHGPQVLISAGLVRGRRLASWPGIADDVRNAGGIWEDAKVVHDRNWVSSRGPADLRAFEPAMIELFAELAPCLVETPRRPVRWVASATRVGTIAGAAALGLAARRVPAMRRRLLRPSASDRVQSAVHDLALATAFGGIAFAKLALDPAARTLASREDRGRMITAPWRAFVYTSGASLIAATVTWIAWGRPRAIRYSPKLAHTKDALLAASLATGLVNAASGLALARADGVPMESGARPSPEAGKLAKVHRTGLLSGYAHMLALAGTIAVSSMLERH